MSRVRRSIWLSLCVAQSVALFGCANLGVPGSDRGLVAAPLTASRAIGLGDAVRDASLRVVIEGLDEDRAGRPSRALARYQRAVRIDATNPFAYLALARHHLEYGSPGEANAFLDQARALFESEGRLGPEVDVWGIGLRAWAERSQGLHASADSRFEAARQLAPRIWDDELLSAGELR